MIILGGRHHRGFFWLALSLSIPIAILSVIGAISLRTDRAVAEAEAKERAQTLSQQAAEIVRLDWTAFLDSEVSRNHAVDSFSHAETPRFLMSEQGQLFFPPPIPSPDGPNRIDPALLTEAQRKLWEKAQALEAQEEKAPESIAAYQEFVESKPPEEFAARALYGAAVLAQRQNAEEAARRFEQIRSSKQLSEMGMPLSQLASFKWIELRLKNHRATGIDLRMLSPEVTALASNLVACPHTLSDFFLDRMRRWEEAYHLEGTGVKNWIETWESQQKARGLHRSVTNAIHLSKLILSQQQKLESVNPAGATNTYVLYLAESAEPLRRHLTRGSALYFWFDDAAEKWLGVALSAGTNQYRVTCRRESDLRQHLQSLIDARLKVQEYFGIGFELAGHTLVGVREFPRWREVFSAGKSGSKQREELDPQKFPPILFASHTTPLSATADLKINVFLTSPDVLFARQRARVFWFGTLIALSAMAALIGLIVAGRAFARQQHLNEMKTNFVSSVSHELRAPIASIRLLAEGLEKGRVKGPEKQGEYFRFIGHECRRLSSLIENVLDFARIDQGRKEYEFEPADLKALVQQSVKLMEGSALDRGVAVKVELPQESVVAECDAHALEQALINLIDNAIKHSPKGSSITVGLDWVDAGRDVGEADTSGDSGAGAEESVRVWVQDEGEGIPPEEHERIFERFYRIGSELRRETQGIGIGLTIVKHIVEAHGGAVRVESSPGTGSRFVIELPGGAGGCRTSGAPVRSEI